jgi:HlyD family secretion protein
VRRFMKASLWVLLFLAVAAGVALKLFAPAAVMTVQARRGPLAAEVFGTGTLESKVVVGVSSKIVGKVIEVLVDQGDVVAAGQVLARLEAKDYDDAVRVAEAQLHLTEAELAKATLDVKRSRGLHENKLVSDAEQEAAETDFRVAQARLKNSEAALGVARAKLGDTQIVCECPGLVVTRNLEVGSTIVPGAPIFRVADTRVLWVQAMVDERETGRLRLGQNVRVVLGANPDSAVAGLVARMSAETDRVTEEREVDVTLDRLPPRFFLGQKADVYVEAARQENALQVPKSTLAMRGGKSGVFVVDRGRARWRPVQLGLRGRDLLEITSGVDERDRLIVNPLAGKAPIADGQRVKAAAAPGKS